MAFSVNYLTKVITIPQADLTLVSGTLYEHDTNAFRLELKEWEASVSGITEDIAHQHNTEVVVAGVTYSRTLEIINSYQIEYENGTYSVRLSGSNNNLFDVENGILVQNSVQVISNNSAGLQTVSSGSGLSATEQARLLDIWRRLDLDSGTANTYQDDNSQITNTDFTLSKTDNGNGTFTINRT